MTNNPIWFAWFCIVTTAFLLWIWRWDTKRKTKTDATSTSYSINFKTLIRFSFTDFLLLIPMSFLSLPVMEMIFYGFEYSRWELLELIISHGAAGKLIYGLLFFLVGLYMANEIRKESQRRQWPFGSTTILVMIYSFIFAPLIIYSVLAAIFSAFRFLPMVAAVGIFFWLSWTPVYYFLGEGPRRSHRTKYLRSLNTKKSPRR